MQTLLARSLRFSAPLLALFAVACGSSGEDASTNSQAPAPADETPIETGAADRAIAEADIVQLDGGKLYAMSRSGSVSVVDVSAPGKLRLLGQMRLAGEPFEMYRRGNLLVAMTNGAFAPDGTAVPVRSKSSYYYSRPADAGAGVVVVDVADPSKPRLVDTFPIPGEIADSRVVGDVLYLATFENARCWGCATSARTTLTSFDLKELSSLRRIDQLTFRGVTAGYNSTTWKPWKRSIMATKERIYLGGLTDSPKAPPASYGYYQNLEGSIDVVDVRDPGGHMFPLASIPIAGPVFSRWQMDERDGVLRVVSQRGIGTSANGTAMPEVETFKIDGQTAFEPLGHTTLALPQQEGLRAVRFDKDRAYAITYRNTDPLFVIDLADPASPKQRGELHMPGFVFHMEPRGDKLLGLGVDRSDPAGNLNVSLFDVKDLDDPRLVQRVSFGPRGGNDTGIAAGELPEDQDRIQKAFRVIEGAQGEHLVVVPFSAPSARSSSRDACSGVIGAVQLVDFREGAATAPLTKRATLGLRGHPRRALANGGELVTVSESNVRTFSLATHDDAVPTADLEIDECTRSEYDGHGYYCSFGPARAGAPAGALFGVVGLLVAARLRRRR